MGGIATLLRVEAFTPKGFELLVADLSTAGNIPFDILQVEYLSRYLDSIGAKTLVVEPEYIDRHYMDEFSHYYSRCLPKRSNRAARINVFASQWGSDDLDRMITSASAGADDYKDVQRDLQLNYLGFIIIRPLPAVPIGRTVLKTLDDSPDRIFPCAVEYIVHFVGFELKVDGLAFQQQDSSVGACATTAVWSALQRMHKHEGGKAPTPREITEAAVRYSVSDRPFPASSGLTVEQICEALRSSGYPPEVLAYKGDSAIFCQTLGCYLSSGIPAILAIAAQGIGHAVTVVGYRQLPPSGAAQKLKSKPSWINLNYNEIYIHDDRIGPYARAFIRPTTRNPFFAKLGLQNTQEQLELAIDLPDGRREVWTIRSALFPLYPKLRSTVRDFYPLAYNIVNFLSSLMRTDAADFSIEIRFDRCGNYCYWLYGQKLDPQRLLSFQKTCHLSRYLGIIRLKRGSTYFLDFLLDTTDSVRLATQPYASIIGVVAHDSIASPISSYLGALWGVPFC